MEQLLPNGVAAKLGPLARYELRALLFALALAVVGIPFGLLLHQVATHGPLTGFDEDGAQWMNDRFQDRDLAITVLKAISFTGKPIFLLFAVGLPGLWVLRNGGRKLAVFLAVTSVGGGAIDTVVKVAVGRPRPEVDEPIISAFGKSFPSGHSMQAVVCYGALLLVFLPLLEGRRRTAAIVATATLIALIGFSRLSLGVHYVSDVLGGYVLGTAWLIASVAAFEIWREDRGNRRTHPLEEGVEPEELVEDRDRHLRQPGPPYGRRTSSPTTPRSPSTASDRGLPSPLSGQTHTQVSSTWTMAPHRRESVMFIGVGTLIVILILVLLLT